MVARTGRQAGASELAALLGPTVLRVRSFQRKLVSTLEAFQPPYGSDIAALSPDQGIGNGAEPTSEEIPESVSGSGSSHVASTPLLSVTHPANIRTTSMAKVHQNILNGCSFDMQPTLRSAGARDGDHWPLRGTAYGTRFLLPVNIRERRKAGLRPLGRIGPLSPLHHPWTLKQRLGRPPAPEQIAAETPLGAVCVSY